MSFYHEHRYTITGFKEYDVTDMGNVYIKDTFECMVPLVIKGCNVYQNKYGKYLLTTNLNGEWYYLTCNKKTMVKSKPIKLTLNLNDFYEATITLKWTEHKKYFSCSRKGIEAAIKWSEELEKNIYCS